MNTVAHLLIASSLSFIGSGAIAAPVMIDFQPGTGNPPPVTETGFTAVTGSPATVGGITFTFTGAFFDRSPGASDSGAFTYADLYNDFAYINGTEPVAPAITLALAGLAANTAYDLRFYSSDFFGGGGGWANSLQTTYSATVGSGASISSTFNRTVNPTSNLQNSVLGSFVSDATGNLTFSIQTSSLDGGNAFTRLNGLELNPTAVPEPTSLWLAGVALLGLGIAARRRHKV